MAAAAPITRRLFGGATATGAVILQSRGRTPDDHIKERRDPALVFDPDAWLDALKAMGGNVWFHMEHDLPEDPTQRVAAVRHFLAGCDTEAKRCAIFRAMVLRETRKIALGIDTIRDRA